MSATDDETDFDHLERIKAQAPSYPMSALTMERAQKLTELSKTLKNKKQ